MTDFHDSLVPQTERRHDERRYRELQATGPGRVNAIDPIEFDPIELRYWCCELNGSESGLSQAIAKVGEHVVDLRLAWASLPRRR